MEGIKANEIDFSNHINKCRICFKSFSVEEHQIEITKTIERKFHEVTQTNLKISKDTSRVICVICSYQLSTISQARKNMILAQRALQSHLRKSKLKKSPETSFIELLNVQENQEEEDEVIEEHLIEDEHFVTEIAEEIVIRDEDEKSQTKNLDISHESTAKTDSSESTKAKASKFVCHECGKSFSGSGSLANHVTIFHSHAPLELLPCSIIECGKKFKTKKQLSQHMKTHSEDKQVCPECGLLVGNKHNLTKHIRRLHLKIYNFYCDLCDYKGFFKFNIDQHMKRHLDKSERERFYCDECPFESISKMSLRTHKRMEHLGQKKTFVCHCGKSFTQSSSYYTHVRVVHQKIKNHACTFAECSKTFSERSQLRNHIKSQHLKTRDLPCTECGKLFATQKHLSAHLKYHRPPTYACEYSNCDNAFYTASQLTAHYKVHNNQRDHQCPFCEKRYFHRSHLKKHFTSTHAGAKI